LFWIEVFATCPAAIEVIPNPVTTAAAISAAGTRTFLLGYFDLDDIEIITY
jgi:hypothetical protein